MRQVCRADGIAVAACLQCLVEQPIEIRAMRGDFIGRKDGQRRDVSCLIELFDLLACQEFRFLRRTGHEREVSVQALQNRRVRRNFKLSLHGQAP